MDAEVLGARMCVWACVWDEHVLAHGVGRCGLREGCAWECADGFAVAVK